VTRLLEALLRVASDLEDLSQRWALVGGLAISVWVEPRTTRDIDLAVAVANDRQAERLVRDLRARGYDLLPEHFEQDAAGRLATVRFSVPGEGEALIVLDLLLSSSGLEPEVVEAALLVEIAPGLSVPVATPFHLLALKVLAGRPQDLLDIQNLLPAASPTDIQNAREALLLISLRGYHRKKDLQKELAKHLAEAGVSGS